MAEKVALLFVIIGVLTALTNIIVEVIKKATWDKLPTNFVALIVGNVLSIISALFYMANNGIAITWYYIVGAIVVGFMTAYAAMFGFDKLKQMFPNVKK